MNQSLPLRGLIAEDEPLLAQALASSLQRLWPQLALLEFAVNGMEAVQRSLAQQPDVLFFDIKMPGQSGLEAARELADEWPAATPFPLLVFVTAYDNYAVQAFEQAAVDYLLKPISDDRLGHTITRLQTRLQHRDNSMELLLTQLRTLAPAVPPAPQRLRMIRAAVGSQIRLIAIDDVIYFAATDKYINVVTADSEALIRTSLKELMAQLDPQQFWQIHRGIVVKVSAMQSVHRDENGRLALTLRQRPESLTISRLFAHLFKQM
jgi:DNA-binding LytR/AlgR family response regulator